LVKLPFSNKKIVSPERLKVLLDPRRMTGRGVAGKGE
jgi:hypothetical protein